MSLFARKGYVTDIKSVLYVCWSLYTGWRGLDKIYILFPYTTIQMRDRYVLINTSSLYVRGNKFYYTIVQRRIINRITE